MTIYIPALGDKVVINRYELDEKELPINAEQWYTLHDICGLYGIALLDHRNVGITGHWYRIDRADVRRYVLNFLGL